MVQGFRRDLLTRPIDGSSLAAFRILFGLTMAAAMVRFIALGWVDALYVEPRFHFTWDAFPYVAPLDPLVMRLLFAALAVLALAIAAGLFTRVAAAAFLVGFTYVELLDKTTYLNHYYLVSLLTGLLVCVPAGRLWSVDAWRRRTPSDFVPAWTLNLLRFQVAVVYLFAGLAKISHDWLANAQPMRIWLAARSDLPMVGALFDEPWVAYAFSWGGALFDLSIVGFLLWRPTRVGAYLAVVVFHAMTGVLFPIGMFPWIMVVSALVFFPPDWPRRWVGASAPAFRLAQPSPYRLSAPGALTLAVYVGVQIALPLRAYWPGTQPEWTMRGFNFGWRVMIAEKAGYTELIATDRTTGTHWPVPLRDYITVRQEQMMVQDPFMVRTLARHVAADLRARGLDVAVRAESFASLNSRPVQRLIDPTVDLSGTTPDGWILPLQD